MRPFLGLDDRIAADDADISLVVLGDSTATAWDANKWSYQFADQLADAYPTHSVDFYYTTELGAWASVVSISTGSGSQTITVWSAGNAGYSCDDHVTNKASYLEHPSAADYVMVALGHNSPYTVTDYTDLFDTIQASWPAAYVVPIVQNERTDDPSAGAAARANTETAALSYGVRPIRIDQAFNAYGDWETDLMLDGVHPNADGYVLWAESVVNAVTRSGVGVGILNTAELLLQAGNYSGSGDWLDESGNGHNASISGASYVDGVFRFTTNDSMTIPDSAGFSFTNAESFTIVIAALKTSSIAANDRIFTSRDYTGSGAGIDFYIHSSLTNRLAGYVSDGSNTAAGDFDAADYFFDDTMTAIGLRLTARSELSLHIDGTKIGATIDPSPVTGTINGINFVVGDTGLGGSFYEGDIKAIALFRSALTDDQISQVGNLLILGSDKNFAAVHPPLAAW